MYIDYDAFPNTPNSDAFWSVESESADSAYAVKFWESSSNAITTRYKHIGNPTVTLRCVKSGR